MLNEKTVIFNTYFNWGGLSDGSGWWQRKLFDLEILHPLHDPFKFCILSFTPEMLVKTVCTQFSHSSKVCSRFLFICHRLAGSWDCASPDIMLLKFCRLKFCCWNLLSLLFINGLKKRTRPNGMLRHSLATLEGE